MDHLSRIVSVVREHNPLVLHITNTVTANDCANISICYGASPVMSDDRDDAVGLMKKAQALLLNIGTTNEEQLNIMWDTAFLAMKAEKPIVLDPVGVGSSRSRTFAAENLIDEFDISVIKGNASEINRLAGAKTNAHGVDSFGDVNVEKMMDYAGTSSIVVVATGKVDLVTDGRRLFAVSNGVPEMGMISGTGCMLGSCIAAGCAVARPLEASIAALSALGIAGERAAERTAGPGTFKPAFFDEVALMTPEIFEENIRVEEVEL
ncbi:MAG TPA: hydroxyethylthiazole kinase [Methanocorpusculum sp.]|nr:hydroxyethylthiazole kinase [Methanocorpusculum sp.]